MKAQNWLYVSCLIGAFAVYGCGDDATSGGYYGSICGNGVVEDGEACDDGNSVNGDGCSADCKAIEPGYVCYEGKPCEQVSGVCGNGKVDDGEACDDGNQVSGDGCSADCKKVESGCKCPEKGGACTCSSESICGNGKVEGDEMCDDSNTDDGDGCNADCMGIESGWECPPEGGKCYPKNGYCGDGIVNRVGEECDGGADGIIGCTNDCKIETGYDCETDSEGRSNCWEMGCGNAKVEPKNGEECDNGMGNNVEVGGYGFDDEGNPQCDNTCHFVAYCGDGTKNGDEECDNGSDNLDNAYQKDQSNGCTKQCKKAGWCGDGKWNGDEKCDPKDPKSNNGCTDECTPKEGYVCSTLDGSCVLKSELPEPGCGNLYIDLALGEECDQKKGNGCTDCKADKGYKCFASPKPCSECSQKDGEQCKELNCGDGILDPDGYEQCDLGKDNNGKGKGCSKTCTIEPGYACKTVQEGGKQTSVCNTVCGDGIRTPDEECDAGKNNGKGKGCSAACRIEDYAICTSNEIGKTSKCKAGKCGDGEIGKGEVCDDVNSVGGDGCSADCKAVEAYFKCPKTGRECSLTVCGDRELNDNDADYVGEECDLGEGKNGEGKGCTDFCRLEPGYECNDTNCTSVREQTACGNGKLEGNEECDDHNKLGGDGCSPDCRIETGFECFNNDATSASVCRPTCGDGIWNITSTKTPGIKAQSVKDLIEECDLGELNGQNLGCTIDCKLQEGYDLELPKVDYPDTIELPVTFRDFKGIDVTASNDNSKGTNNEDIGRADENWITKINDKYRDFEWNDCERVKDGGSNSSGEKVPLQKASADKGHPDFENMTGNLCTGILGSIGKGILGRDGKPVLTRDAMTSECADYERKIVNGTEVDSPGRKNKMVKNHIYCQASFDTWYRDDAKMNLNIPNGKLLLAKQPGTNDTYVFDSANPPAGAKIVSGKFTYAEINNKLQIKKDNTQYYTKSYFAPLYDFGLNEGIVSESSYLKDKNANGSFTTEIHTTIQYRGNVATLEFSGDDDVWVYLNNRLFVDVGGMHSKITRSHSIKVENCNGQKCDKTFGLYDGGIYDLKLFHAERARSGSNFKLTLTGFVPTAKNVPGDFKSVCGDGIVAVGREECDYGDKNKNDALYKLMSCDPKTCKKVENNPLKTCGNGIVEPGEMCDTGFLCKEAKYQKICEQYGLKFVEDENCSKECTIVGSNCGNGIKESGEDCDLGKKNAKDGECTPDCKFPHCGDGYVNSAKGEECDMGDVENAKGIVCTEKCKFPYCGDGIVSEYNGEVCDDGINDGSYGHCGVGCTSWGPRCGDGIVDAGKEECDNGAANKDGKYGGCTTSCTWGPRCGDGIVQEGDNEECDEGANNGKPGSGCTVACRMIVN